MKIRNDFVTNSSSSSFIFGEPLGMTVSKESVFNELKIICSNMLYIINELEMIYFENEDYKKKILYLRKYYNNYDKIASMLNIVEKDSKSLFSYLMSKEDLSFSVDDCFDVFINELGVLTKIKKFVTYNTFNQYKEKPVFYFNIVDFRVDNKDDYDDIETIAYWYLDALEQTEINNLCYNQLGEVAITSESSYMPNFIVHYLEKHLEYCCGHMG